MTGTTHLVEQYGEENLENQQYDPDNHASICRRALHKRGGIFQGENDESEEEREYRDDGGFHYNGDKECILFRWSRDAK